MRRGGTSLVGVGILIWSVVLCATAAYKFYPHPASPDRFTSYMNLHEAFKYNFSSDIFPVKLNMSGDVYLMGSYLDGNIMNFQLRTQAPLTEETGKYVDHFLTSVQRFICIDGQTNDLPIVVIIDIEYLTLNAANTKSNHIVTLKEICELPQGKFKDNKL